MQTSARSPSSPSPFAAGRIILFKHLGFSLVEMAVVMAILALLLGGGLALFTSQQEVRRAQETLAMLETSRDALIGFAAANGRLPCPATAASAVESLGAGGDCTNPYDGFLPAVTLGLASVDGGGNAMDAWNTPQNRIRYAVTTSNGSAFIRPNGMQATTMAILTPDLHVCGSASGVSAIDCGTATILTTNAVAVIYSLGKNAATGGTGTDENANPNPNSTATADQVFVSHSPTSEGMPNGEFDDLVTWLSPNILYNRMLAAGRLP